jgi:LPXTG-site transpeptidase (sortase) family protein
MKKFIVFFLIIVFAIFAGGIFGKTIQSEQTRVGNTLDHVSQPSSTPTPTQNPIGKPVGIAIPKLRVNTTVEHVGNDAKGNMDVPKSDDASAWYQLGFRPGQQGNAVIAGHYDRKNGGPAVFYDLKKLEKGDEIIITDEEGKKLTFVVIATKTYPYNEFPVKEIFGPAEKKYLNLITCGGNWNSEKKIYADRVVVRSELQKE